MNHSIGENHIRDIPLPLDMIQGQLRNDRITKWMLPVVLVLSLFTFSGVSTPSSAKLFKTATEQIDLVRASKKKFASFKITSLEQPSRFDHAAIGFEKIAIYHTGNIRTQVKQCTWDCLGFIVFSPSLVQYPQSNSEEDFSISQIG